MKRKPDILKALGLQLILANTIALHAMMSNAAKEPDWLRIITVSLIGIGGLLWTAKGED